MGRNRIGEQLPRYVYFEPRTSKYSARVYDKKLGTVGTFTTAEEAEYNQIVAENKGEHHWSGLEDGPYFGFIYLITNKKSGKRYVGKKQFLLWDGPTGGYKCHDMSSEWFDPKAWRDNDWHFYTGSCKPLNREVANGNVWDYSFEVIQMCRTGLECHIAEVNYQIEHNVLEATDEDGEYLWYNGNIAGLEFRPPFKKEEVRELSAKSAEAMRNYYLKPTLCSRCGTVVPFGEHQCCPDYVAPPKVQGEPFNDITK